MGQGELPHRGRMRKKRHLKAGPSAFPLPRPKALTCSPVTNRGRGWQKAHLTLVVRGHVVWDPPDDSGTALGEGSWAGDQDLGLTGPKASDGV